MKRQLITRVLIGFCVVGIAIAQDAPPTKFSALSSDQALPATWRVISLPKVTPNKFALVRDEGATVLRVDSDHGAGALGIPLNSPSAATQLAPGTRLHWRWKVDRVIDSADMQTKRGDDFAARVYVFFDVPFDSLPFFDRLKIRLARMFSGAEVPTAALCYVWDNQQPVGHSQWSPYTSRVRVIVMQSGASKVNGWIKESRDIAADFRAAFGTDAPRVTGVAVGSDTDNTGERVTSWFGDLTLSPTP
jgi:hypothetical protein